jgi:hypothetical protein
MAQLGAMSGATVSYPDIGVLCTEKTPGSRREDTGESRIIFDDNGWMRALVDRLIRLR